MDPSPSAHRSVHVYVGVLAAAALGAAALAVRHLLALPPPSTAVAATAFAIFASMVVLQWQGVSFHWRGHRLTTQLDEIAVFLGMLLLPEAMLVFLIPAAALVTHAWKGRSALKGAFNVAAFAIGAGAGVLVDAFVTTDMGASPLLGAIAGTAAYALVANLLLAGVFALLEGVNLVGVFAERLAGPTTASVVVGSAGGLTVVALLAVHPLALAALAPFGYLLWRFGVLSAQADRELSVHRDLGAVTHDLVGCTSIDMAADRVLDACGRLLESGRVTLALADGRTWSRTFDPAPTDFYVGQALPGRTDEPLGELRVHPRRGKPTFSELERELLRLIAGQVAGAVENTRTLAAFESARGKLELYLTTAQDAVLLIGPDGRVDYVNAAGARLFGLEDRPQGAGRSPSLLADHRAPNAHASDFFHHPVLTRRESLDGPVLIETEARDRSGARTFVVEAHTAPVQDGQGASLLAVVRDVTERKRLEQETSRQRELIIRQEKLSALGTLVAGVAHEVNNPLTFMKSNLDLAIDDARRVLARGDASPDARKLAQATLESMDAMAKGIQRITTITSSLKSVARQSRKQQMEDLNAVAADVVAVLKAGMPRNVKLEADLASDLPRVYGNAGQLHQVILNLVKNAIEAFAGRDGRIALRTRADADGVRLEVADDGPGIPAEVLERLFEPFQTTKDSGTGLGLSISREIVRAHGGDVTVATEPGQGTTFVVTLPAARAPAVAAP